MLTNIVNNYVMKNSLPNTISDEDTIMMSVIHLDLVNKIVYTRGNKKDLLGGVKY